MKYSFLSLLFVVLTLLAPALRAQDVRITEFLTTNTAGISDENATYQPWIELWNASSTAKVVLTSYTLSNGTTT